MTSHSSGSPLLQKIGGYTVVLLILVLGGGLFYQTLQMKLLKENLSKNRELITTELHSFREDIGRSQTQLVNTEKELKKIISGIPAEIKRDVDKWGAEIVSAAKFRVASKVRNSGEVRSTRSKRSPSRSPVVAPVVSRTESPRNCNWEYSDWRLTGKFKGTCGKGDFSYSLSQVFEGLLIEAGSSGASPSYLKVWEIGPDGKRLEKPLVLQDFTVTKKKANLKKMHWLAPHLDIGISFQTATKGEGLIIPDIGISASGYGATKDDLDWRFFKVSIGPHDDGVSINLCPTSYNIGKKIPLVSNIWVGGCYSYNAGHAVTFQLNGVL